MSAPSERQVARLESLRLAHSLLADHTRSESEWRSARNRSIATRPTADCRLGAKAFVPTGAVKGQALLRIIHQGEALFVVIADQSDN